MRATPDFDFALGETADMIRDTDGALRRRRTDRATRSPKADAEDWFPRDELWTQMGDLGLHGITVEEEFGGLGSAISSMSSRTRKSARASGRGRPLATARTRTSASTRSAAGQCRGQKAKYLPRLISGEHVGSAGDVAKPARAATSWR